ncbi:metallophosphoesterase [Dysgonomonas sp. OttesenSCG-928-M03]|nr:metallophosphoesterase [Dysgonomonas sp. OttesenSCG-928-M03]
MRYLFFILVIILFLAGNYYVFLRAWQAIPANTITRSLLIVFAIIVIASFFLVFLTGEILPVKMTSIFYAIGTSWFFTFIYFLIINLVMDLVKVTRVVPRDTFNQYTKENWLSFGLIVGFIGLLMLCGYLKYRTKERVELPVTVNKAGTKINQLKIVAISDMHLGYGIGRNEFRQWVELINKEEPDIVLIAGDIIDSSLRPINEARMYLNFKDIKTKYGIYAIPGNHEYISGISGSMKFFEDAGVHLLRDSSALIDSTFYIVGRDDKTNPNRKALEELTASLDKSKPIILLDHQPYNLEEAENNGIDFQFSGHTHRGQIWPISLITDLIYEDSYGYLKKGNTDIYVSSGIGIWGGKFRIGTQSEYVVVNMKMQ